MIVGHKNVPWQNQPVQVHRDPQIISGFIYDEPVDDLPALTHCGEALCCRGHRLPWHEHEGFEFIYLSRGRANWQSGTALHAQQMGDLFVTFPHERHRSGTEANPENQHTWVGLHLEKLGPSGAALARQIRKADLHLLTGCHELQPILHAIIGQVVTLRPRRTAAIRMLLQSFVALVEQRLLLELAPGRAQAAAMLPYSLSVQKAIAYQRQNLDRRLPLAEVVAVAMARSIPSFCSQFRREVGVTPALYHARLRLEAARGALSQPAAEITTVALQFGFSSSQHFSTLFKHAFGISPREWKIKPRDESRNR